MLNRLLASVDLRREDVFITNIIKCRPPNNRLPWAEEIANCSSYLHEQVALVQPKVICTLGPYTRS